MSQNLLLEKYLSLKRRMELSFITNTPITIEEISKVTAAQIDYFEKFGNCDFVSINDDDCSKKEENKSIDIQTMKSIMQLYKDELENMTNILTKKFPTLFY